MRLGLTPTLVLAAGWAVVACAQAPPEGPSAPLNLGGTVAVSLSDDSLTQAGDIRPKVLRDPLEDAHRLKAPDPLIDLRTPLIPMPADAPHGYTGPSGIIPREEQSVAQFTPVEDRWRQGIPDYDRYGKGHPGQDDYLGIEGSLWDPYNQNVLKGDYPIYGQHTFLRLNAKSFNLFEGRQVPTPVTPFEATRDPFNAGFFGDPDSYSLSRIHRCPSTCSTATRRSNRPIGASRSNQSST